MINIDLFTSAVQMDAPGAPVSLVEAQLLSAAIEFCRESLIWSQAFADITTVQDQSAYAVADPTDARIVLLYGLTLSGIAINPVFELPNQFDLVNAPNPDLLIQGRMALIPARSATTLTDILYDQYHDALVSGALAKLLIQHAQPWGNPGMVEYHRGLFEQGMIDAKTKALRGFSGADNLNNASPMSLGVTA